MIGYLFLTVGGLLAVVGVAWMFGPVVLIVAGGVLVLFGLFVDFDRRVEEPRNAKSRSAPP